MVHRVKCLLCKHEDQSLDPNTHDNAGQVCIPSVRPAGRKRAEKLQSWLPRLA